ncbi:MAG: cache domain-containing protein [Nitrospira sp.]|nr:cache domain-containing protein [bacterium]MBL7049243.1 cache domain-containing protein [Nitrospira sp.]
MRGLFKQHCLCHEDLGRAWPEILKLFSILFLPGLLAIAGGIWILYSAETEHEMTRISMYEAHNVEQALDVLDDDFITASSDLIYLSNQRELQGLLSSEIQNPAKLAHDYLEYSRAKKIYDQIRFIDNAGMEIVRVDYTSGNPVIVPKEELQNKAASYYFRDTLQLHKGEVYISPLDLNIDNGRVEQPIKPMIRFGMPVFDNQDTKRGIIMLNYFGNRMLSNFVSVSKSGSKMLLLNMEGYYLKGFRPEDEWGFMYDKKAGRTLQAENPEAWLIISGDEKGQFISDGNLYTYRTLYPLKMKSTYIADSARAFQPSKDLLGVDQYYWKIVSYVPALAIETASMGVIKRLSGLTIIMVLLLAAVSWRITMFMFKEKRMHQRAEDSSSELEKTKNDLDQNREKIVNALERITTIMVKSEAGAKLTFDNPNLQKCYDVLNCDDQGCVCYGKEAERCWTVEGTCGANGCDGQPARKFIHCSCCQVFKEATVDPTYYIGEHFNAVVHVLESKHNDNGKTL